MCVCVGGWLTVNRFLSNFNSWDFSTDVTPISSAISPNLSQVLSRASCSVTSWSTVVTHPEEYYTFLSALSFKVRISYILHILCKEKIPRLDWLFIDSKLRALPECKLPKLLFILTIPENSGETCIEAYVPFFRISSGNISVTPPILTYQSSFPYTNTKKKQNCPNCQYIGD